MAVVTSTDDPSDWKVVILQAMFILLAAAAPAPHLVSLL
jgi:hypothetical protein